ncbi:MAG: hypothetical protein DRQ89_09165 [Epsilonproteobacteria bacterium]|nr:MAG: hypothetical protein DRQ89_09165 [Campylobacterota bacterium]
MLYQFCKYFFSYIFFSKTRQRLLFLAIAGLFLSSFSLLVLQSTMGGLQYNLMERSKRVSGKAEISLNGNYREISELIKKHTAKYSIEYEIELLLRFNSVLSPVIVHGIDLKGPMPDFLKSWPGEELVMPYDLAAKLGAAPGDEIKLISPSHVDPMMGDLPRYGTAFVSGPMIETMVPEIDIVHTWVRLPFIQNLIQKRAINKIRIYEDLDWQLLKRKLEKFPGSSLTTWDENNQSLVWALRLESTVMVFLFAAMTLLVSLCITSGLLIFFDKVKVDLASFWILGASKGQLGKASVIFIHALSFFSVLLGLLVGLIFLWAFDSYGGEVMPDIFIERKIPVRVTAKGLLVSFSIPYLISIIFSYFSLKQFKEERDLLEHVRVVG